MRPEHLSLWCAASSPHLTPDARQVVFAVSRPDPQGNTYPSALWVSPTESGPARRLTNGPADTSPRLSPDGTRVAFLRPTALGKPAQVAVTGLHGGEPRILTDLPLGASDPVWSPDGTRIAFVARVAQESRYGTDDDVSANAEPPRLIEHPQYRMDGIGFVRDRRQHLFVVDLPDSDVLCDDVAAPVSARQLTDGDADDVRPAWSPDSSRIAFISARHDSREEDLRHQVWAVGLDGAPESLLADPGLGLVDLAWPVEDLLVLVAEDFGPDGKDFVAANAGLFRVQLPGANPDRLTDADTVNVATGTNRLAVRAGHAHVMGVYRGRQLPLAVSLDSSQPVSWPQIADGPADSAPPPLVVGDLSVVVDDATGQVSTVAIVATADRVGDVAVLTGAAASPARFVTDLSARLRREAGLIPPVELWATSDDGSAVHGWIVPPDSERFGDGPHPTLLLIHGGPYAQFTCAAFDEAQMYAGAGYAVVMCNPRGSAGYGREHGAAIRHGFGSLDYRDVMAFLDHALRDPRLDERRVGVMGGSYGGYLTALITTRTDRFAGAVVERGVLDLDSFVGSSDIGWFFTQGYNGDRDQRCAQSPMSAIDKVVTPTMVIHSEQDWRCPIDQGQRWFEGVRATGTPAQLLLFPGEGHELTRSGQPRHRVQRFDALLAWWQRWLPTTPA